MEAVKHQWQDIGPQNLLAPDRRQCAGCGVIQHKEERYLWMRRAGSAWRPLVGRCKPAKTK